MAASLDARLMASRGPQVPQGADDGRSFYNAPPNHVHYYTALHSGPKDIRVANVEWFGKETSKPNSLLEAYSTGQRLRAFFDVDVTLEVRPSDEFITARRAEVVAAAEAFIGGRVRVASRHRALGAKYKLSWRLFAVDKSVRCVDAFKRYLLAKGVVDLNLGFDMAVYGQNRKLWAIRTASHKDGAVLLPENDEEASLYCIQNIDGCTDLDVTLQSELMQPCHQSTQPLQTQPSDTVPLIKLQRVVSALADARATCWSDCIRVIWAIRHTAENGGYVDKGRHVADSFAQRCMLEYSKDPSWATTEYDRAGRAEGPCPRLGFGSIVEWLRQDRPLEAEYILKPVTTLGKVFGLKLGPGGVNEAIESRLEIEQRVEGPCPCCGYRHEREVWCIEFSEDGCIHLRNKEESCRWRAVIAPRPELHMEELVAAVRAHLNSPLATLEAVAGPVVKLSAPQATLDLRTLKLSTDEGVGYMYDNFNVGNVDLSSNAPVADWRITRPENGLVVLKNDGVPRTILSAEMEGEQPLRVWYDQPDGGGTFRPKKHHKRLVEEVRAAIQRGIHGCLVRKLGVPGNVVMNAIVTIDTLNQTIVPESDADVRPHSDIFAALHSAGLLVNFVEVSDGGAYYIFSERTGLWHKTDRATVATSIRLKVLPVAEQVLTADEIAFMKSADGARKVLESVTGRESLLFVEGFEDGLDPFVPGLLPVANGMYDARTGDVRPLVREDRCTMTTGYAVPPVAQGAVEVEAFYAKVLPVPEERELFMRCVAAALFGSAFKHFVILSDRRAGNNGKSALMEAVEDAFGNFAGKRCRNLLMQSANTDPNSHSGNVMDYRGKRLAYIDEPPTAGTVDISRLKDLTSSKNKTSGRGVGCKEVIQFRWRALIVMTCNEGCFPRLPGCTDPAFMNRVIAIPCRAKFVSNPPATEEEHTHLADEDINDRMRQLAPTHMAALAAAYVRFKEFGFGDLPASVVEFREAIMGEADPLIQACTDWAEANLAFVKNEVVERAKVEGPAMEDIARTLGRSEKVARVKEVLRKIVRDMGGGYAAKWYYPPGKAHNNVYHDVRLKTGDFF